jgi:hypothetical protein
MLADMDEHWNGKSVEVDVVVDPSGRYADLTLKLDWDGPPPEFKGDSIRREGAIQMDGPGAGIHRRTIATQSGFLDGTTRMVALWPSTKGDDPAAPVECQAVFVSLEVARLDVIEREADPR